MLAAWAAACGGGGAAPGVDAPPGGGADAAPGVDAPPIVDARAGGGAVRAFPGAEGPGAVATGGRGGRVIAVTTLNPTGPGSLGEALGASGARIVVFRVSGVVNGTMRVGGGDVTVAGQTAPGAGITVAGQLISDDGASNIILRHLRVRPPPKPASIDGNQYDGVLIYQAERVMLDHLSISWGVDETLDLYEASDATLSWSIIGEAVVGGHPDGPEHNYGMIHGPDAQRIAVHHNYFVHQKNRNPAIANGPADVRNNVIYNARHGFVHHNPSTGAFNIVGNHYKQGMNDSLIPFFFDDDKAASVRYFLAGNFIEDPADGCNRVVDDPWSDACHPSFASLSAPASMRAASEHGFAWPAIPTQPVAEARALVLARAGAWPRDVVDRRFVADFAAGTGTWGTTGSDRPANLLEDLTPGSAPADGDGDGMPDAWESARGLDPAMNDSARVMPSGYTAIEDYINELADGFL
jgi:pectate lyase